MVIDKNILTALMVLTSSAWGADRLNLWPFLSIDDNVCDIIWPIGHFESKDNWRVFPIVHDSDSFSIVPAVSFRNDACLIGPLFFDYDWRRGCVCPVVWWQHKASRRYNSLFPLYYYSSRFSDSERPDRLFWAAGGLAGWRQDRDQMTTSWLLPFYLRKPNGFWSLPVVVDYGADNKLDRLFFPPLLSGYSRHAVSGDRLTYLLMGLCGSVANERTGFASWMFPLYYHDRESFYTFLYGQNKTSRWLLPFFYQNENDFVTPLYAMHTRPQNERRLTIPPVLSSATWSTKTDDYRWMALMGLVGGGRKENASTSWMFPLYYSDARNFYSLIYGSEKGVGHYWLTPLVGTYDGNQTGGWFFPFFSYKKDRYFDERIKLSEADVLPEKYRAQDARVSARISRSVGLFSDFDQSVHVRAVDKESASEVIYASKRNIFFFNRSETKKVRFDRASGRRLSQEDRDDSGALGGYLYKRQSRVDSATGTRTSLTSVFHRLWRREERNGDVTTDIFPGFTHDTRNDGSSKTSFLWRFYRHEHNPATGTTLDLLFIPILRPQCNGDKGGNNAALSPPQKSLKTPVDPTPGIW